jgi:hypothetical protein
MTESEVLEAVQNYAKEMGFEASPPKNNLIIMNFSINPSLKMTVKYEPTGGGGAWITFNLLIGQILDPGACIDLFLTGRYPGTSFYLRGGPWKDFIGLFVETFVHLRNDMTSQQATDEMCLVADMLTLLHLPPQNIWPEGVNIYLYR